MMDFPREPVSHILEKIKFGVNERCCVSASQMGKTLKADIQCVEYSAINLNETDDYANDASKCGKCGT